MTTYVAEGWKVISSKDIVLVGLGKDELTGVFFFILVRTIVSSNVKAI